MSLYNQLISLLAQCSSAETFAALRSRFAHEGINAPEVEAARESARVNWLLAKEMYCSNKEYMDTVHNSIPDGGNNYFTAMRDVIDKEVRETLEKEALGEEVR